MPIYSSIQRENGRLKRFFSSVASGNEVLPPASVVDLTAYTEVDPSADIAITPDNFTMTVTSALQNIDAYLYKDYTAGFFDAIDLDFEAYLDSATSAAASPSTEGGIAFANAVNDYSGFSATDMAVMFYRINTAVRLYLYNVGTASDFYAAAVNTVYYCTLVRAAGNTSASLFIYSDAGRTTLLDTLTVTGYGTTTYRYHYAFVNWNKANGSTSFSGYFSDFVFN